MPQDDTLTSLICWTEQLRREQSLDLVIDIVAQRADQEEGEVHLFLVYELAGLLNEAGRSAEAIQLLEQTLDRYPDEVRPALIMTSIHLITLERPEDALMSIEVALERARRSGAFLREALGNKARILLELSRGNDLSDVLEEIMSVQVRPSVPDIARERDFVDRAPPGLIRANVLERYNEFRPRRSSDGSGHEPPEFGPAKDFN